MSGSNVLKWGGGLIAILLLLVVLVLGTMRLGWWNPSYDEVARKHGTPPSKFVMVGDVKLHVRDEGQGPAVLMLHSSMSNLRIWDAYADRLKDRYRVIRVDWPPYGLSHDPKPSRGMPGVVELLERFAVQEGLGRLTLVGSSSGATISVIYAATHPERVEALALSALPLAAPPPEDKPVVLRTWDWLHQNLVPNYYPRFYYQNSLSYLYGEPSRLKPETVDWYYETNNIPGGFARVRQYWAANAKAVWSKGAGEEAASVRAPILLQWGDRDPVLPKYLASDAVAQFANAPVTLIHYPDVSHYPMIEIPEKSGADLEAFLDRVHGPRGSEAPEMGSSASGGAASSLD